MRAVYRGYERTTGATRQASEIRQCGNADGSGDEWLPAAISFLEKANEFHQITLSIIARAGFGFKNSKDEVPPGHEMAFVPAMETVAREIFIRAALPSFLWGGSEDRKAVRVSGLAGRGLLGSRIRSISIAYSEIQVRT